MSIILIVENLLFLSSILSVRIRESLFPFFQEKILQPKFFKNSFLKNGVLDASSNN